jgi:succinate dehydrogenase/fumarate reductase flavoprotein subunit
MRTGRELFAALADRVGKTANIRILWTTAATRLTQDDARRVVGVQANGADDIVTVNGRSGVILTTGGYEFDAAAKLNFLKAPDIHFYGNPANTGDGLRMAQAAGADLWHMNVMIGRAIGHYTLPDGTNVNVPILAGPPGGYVITDSRGARFMDESRQAQGMHDVYNDLLPFDSAAGEYTRIPCFYFFDNRRMSSPLTMLNMAAAGVGLYDWSPDNQREVERGWISCADTIREAAARAGVREPDVAEETVLAFNAACKAGSDLYRNNDLEPIVGPPYYCIPLYPGGSNTIGGPRRNERAQIVNPFDEAIAGLYGAGELGSVIGALYPAGGCNLSDAFCFGQIAAESALGLLEPGLLQGQKAT